MRETKVSKQREIRLSTNIFAAANSAKGMPKELLSRFRVLHLPQYTKEEFIHASTKVLVAKGSKLNLTLPPTQLRGLGKYQGMLGRP